MSSSDLEVYDSVRKNGLRLRHASYEQKDNKGIVLAAIRSNCWAIQFASKSVRSDRDVLRTAIARGFQLNRAKEELKQDKIFVKRIVETNGLELKYAPARFRKDMPIVLLATKQNWRAFEFASIELRNDPDIVEIICCKQKGYLAIQFTTDAIKNNKPLILKILNEYGLAIQYVSDELRSDIDVVTTAAKSNPDSLKYALNGLNQNRECLIAANLWDENYNSKITALTSSSYTHNNSNSTNENSNATVTISNDIIENNNNNIKIVLSTRFSLCEGSSSVATQFTAQLKLHPYISSNPNNNFIIYSPNAFMKNTCDPLWTRIDWKCRGTKETCCILDSTLKTGTPKINSCWRYSFRYQLEDAKKNSKQPYEGFMIQLADHYNFKTNNYELGKGQQIETEMANSVGIKIFRIFQPKWNTQFRKFVENDIDIFINDYLIPWYNNNSSNDNNIKCKYKINNNAKCDVRLPYFHSR